MEIGARVRGGEGLAQVEVPEMADELAQATAQLAAAWGAPATGQAARRPVHTAFRRGLTPRTQAAIANWFISVVRQRPCRCHRRAELLTGAPSIWMRPSRRSLRTSVKSSITGSSGKPPARSKVERRRNNP